MELYRSAELASCRYHGEDGDVFQSVYIEYSPQQLVKECVNDAISYDSYDLYPIAMEAELLQDVGSCSD